MNQPELLVVVALLIGATVVYTAYHRTSLSQPVVPVERVAVDLLPTIERLARSAWGPGDRPAQLHALDPARLAGAASHVDLLAELLSHVRRVASALSVPYLTPRIVVAPVLDAAGLFSESGGWVTITVSNDFFLNKTAACSILCHEVCHYVLNANGIREPDTLTNERLTDVAMFVFGLGDVFLAGYRAGASRDYAPAHRLGYLSDSEYRFVDQATFDLWASGRLQPTNEEALEIRLAARIHDAPVRRRFIEATQRKYPHESRADAIQRVLDQHERDRR